MCKSFNHLTDGKTITPKEAKEQLGEEATAILKNYKEHPSPDTFFQYKVLLAKFKALISGLPYVAPEKLHDLPLSNIYMHHKQKDHLNFYVGVLSRFKRKCLWSIETMQVGIDDGAYYLGYHPEWYKYMPVEEVVFVLEHEAHHILQGHVPRLIKGYNALKPVDEKNPTEEEIKAVKLLQSLSNIAADEAVNSLLLHSMSNKNLGLTDLIDPGDYGHPEKWSYDEYLASWMLNPLGLYEHKQEGSGGGGKDPNGSGKGTMSKAMGGSGSEGGGEAADKAQEDFENSTGSSGHTWIKDLENGKAMGPDDTQEAAIENARAAAKEAGIDLGEEGEAAAAAAQGDTTTRLNDLADSLVTQGKRALIESARECIAKRGRGIIPGTYHEMFEELTKVDERHWSDIFETFVNNTREFTESFRINNVNRNTILMGPLNRYGFKEDDPKYHIEVAIDTSGSMSKDDVEEGLAVVKAIQASDSEVRVTLVEFDTGIHRVSNMDSNTLLNKDVWGRGGTDFNCVFKRLMNEVADDDKPDMLIIFTDGGAPPPQKEWRIPEQDLPVLWVLTSNRPDYWFLDNNDPYGTILSTVKKGQ